MSIQVILGLGTILVLGFLGFMMSRSIKKLDVSKPKKKKGKNKYMPEAKRPGR